MVAWRGLLVAGRLATCSALLLRDGVTEDPHADDAVASSPQAWAGSDVAVLLPLTHCLQNNFWKRMSGCITNVVSGAREAGRTVSVHAATGGECSGNFSEADVLRKLRVPDGVQASVRTMPANSSGQLLSAQLAEARAAGAEHDLLLVMGLKAPGGVLHRAVESLCGSVPQVVSVLQKFHTEESMQLLAPLGTMMTHKTKTANILPGLRRQRFHHQDETCEKLFSQERLQRLEGVRGSEATKEESVAVAGGMYWARHKALPQGIPELSDGLRAKLGTETKGSRDAQRAVLEVWIPTHLRLSGGVLAEIPPAPKPMAMYLPQYHPIPENDRLYGKDFTEWTLLKPFEGEEIRKPLPVEKGGLGYYDLLDTEVRRKQAELARDNGIHGFVYYHYWFSSVEGHKVMHKVPELRIADGQPDLPFMLSWANQAWTKGEKNETVLEQDYGDFDEWVEHFNYLLQFFKHPKYIRVEGKPAFAIHRPGLMHEKLEKMLTVWYKMAKDSGLPGLHVVSAAGASHREPGEKPWQATPMVDAAFHLLSSERCCWSEGHEPPAPRHKQAASTISDSDEIAQKVQYWGAYAGFDDRPRRQGTAFVPNMTKLNPSDFGTAVRFSLEGMAKNPQREIADNLYFIASWNQWSEQSALEPDDKYGFDFLHALRDMLRKMPVRVFAP